MVEEVAAKIYVDCERERVSQKAVMALVIKHLNLQDQISAKANNQELAEFETREKLWKFY